MSILIINKTEETVKEFFSFIYLFFFSRHATPKAFKIHKQQIL